MLECQQALTHRTPPAQPSDNVQATAPYQRVDHAVKPTQPQTQLSGKELPQEKNKLSSSPLNMIIKLTTPCTCLFACRTWLPNAARVAEHSTAGK